MMGTVTDPIVLRDITIPIEIFLPAAHEIGAAGFLCTGTEEMNRVIPEYPDYRKHRLPNGLILLMENVPGVRTVAAGIWVRQGSRHESFANQGVTHFLEHMLFKGTDGADARQLAKAMDALGGQFDAATGKESVCLVAKCIDENLERTLDLLDQILLHPVFPEREIQRERRVVLEELSMAEDDPEEWVQERSMQSFWLDHPISHNILGNRRSIRALNRDALMEYYRAFLSSPNIIIVIAGHIGDFARVHEIVQERFGHLTPSSPTPVNPPPVFHSGARFVQRKLGQVYFQIALPWLSLSHPRHVHALIANTILGGNMSSLLFQTLRERHGLAYQIGSFEMSFSDCGILSVFGSTSMVRFQKAMHLTRDCLAQLADGDVSTQDFQQAKLCLKGNVAMSDEGSSRRMATLVRQEMNHGRRFRTDEVLDLIAGVSYDEFRSFLTSNIKLDHVNFVALGPFNRRRIDPDADSMDQVVSAVKRFC